MKKRLLCLLLCLTVLFGTVGCTETPETNSQSSAATDDTQPNDFYTQNGQGFLPTEAKIPDNAKTTDTENLYRLTPLLPAGSIEQASFTPSSPALHGDYFLNGSFYHSTFSWTDGSLLSTQKLPYRGNAGVLANGDYWVANRDGLEVTFYSPDGKASKKLTTNNNYRGSMMPNYVTVSPDGSTVIAGFATGAPFVMIDLKTKEKTRVTTAEGNSETWTFCGEADGKILFSGNGGSLLELNTADKTFRQIDGDMQFDKYYDGLYRIAGISTGLILQGQKDSQTALMVFNFAEAEEIALDLRYGVCVTVKDPFLSFYDVRSNKCMAKVSMERNVKIHSAVIGNDGLVYITAFFLSTPVCYVFNPIPAFKEDGTDGALETELCITNDVNELLENRAEEIGQKHGIRIFCGSEGNDFPTESYLAKSVTDLGAVLNALQEVDKVLSYYPEGMIREAIEGHSGMHLYLCGSLYGVDGAEQDRVGGFTTDYGSTILVVVDIYNGIDSTLPHELSHVFDRKISACSSISFSWLNVWLDVTPYDDAYLNTYEGYGYATEYTVGYESNYDNIWFTDGYGRTFPTEDRARLMECMFDSETGFMKDLLKYDNLAYKARLYSYILRQCFTSCQVEEELYWERFTGIPNESEFADLINQKAA